MNARPEADSPSWDGPVYAIDIPSPVIEGQDQLFHLDTTEAGHERMVKALEDNGVSGVKTYIEWTGGLEVHHPIKQVAQ